MSSEKEMQKLIDLAIKNSRTELPNGMILDENDSIKVGDRNLTDMRSMMITVKRSNYKKVYLFARERGMTINEVVDSILDSFDTDSFIKRKLITPMRAKRDSAIQLIARSMLAEAKTFCESSTTNDLSEKDVTDCENVDDLLEGIDEVEY